MAFGDFFGNMGNVAIGMQEGELVRGRIRQQNLQAERDASDIRQRQEQEAWLRNRRAESDRESMQFSAGTLPAMNSVPVQAIPNEGGGATAPATAPQTTTATDYGDPYAADREVYRQHLDAEKRRGESYRKAQQNQAIRANPSAAHAWNGPIAESDARVQGYQTGLDMYGQGPEAREVPAIAGKGSAGYSAGKAAADKSMREMFATRIKNLGLEGSPFVSPELLAALRATEGSGANAVSSRGARGQMQITPGAFSDVAAAIPGRKWNFNSEEDRVDAAIVYSHLIGQRLKAKGIEPTPQAIASAYHQGVGGVLKNGVASPNVNDGITTNAQYVDRFNRKLGPAQQGDNVATAQNSVAAPAQAGDNVRTAQNFVPVGQAEAVVPQQQYDLAMMQLKSRFSSLERLKRNTFDPTEKAKISAMQDEINMSAQDMQVQRLGSAAMANPQALQQLTGMFASRMGTPIAIQQDGRGNGRLVTPDGKPLAGPWGQVQPLKNIVSSMTESVSPSLSAARTQDSNAYSKAYWDTLGKSQGQQNLEIGKINAKGAQDALVEEIKGNYHLQTEMAKAGLDANKIKRIEFNPDGKGGYVVATSDHLFEVNPGKPNALGMPTRPTVRVVNGIGNG